MAKLVVPDGMSIVQYVEQRLCQELGLDYKRSKRKCPYQFEMVTGKVINQVVVRDALPAPVQEVMDGFLEQALNQQYDTGMQAGHSTGFTEGYQAGHADGKDGKEPEFEGPPVGYDGVPIAT